MRFKSATKRRRPCNSLQVGACPKANHNLEMVHGWWLVVGVFLFLNEVGTGSAQSETGAPVAVLVLLHGWQITYNR